MGKGKKKEKESLRDMLLGGLYISSFFFPTMLTVISVLTLLLGLTGLFLFIPELSCRDLKPRTGRCPLTCACVLNNILCVAGRE